MVLSGGLGLPFLKPPLTEDFLLVEVLELLLLLFGSQLKWSESFLVLVARVGLITSGDGDG